MNNSLKVFRLPIRVTACLFSLANRFSHWMILGLVVILCLLEIGAYRTQGVIPVIASRAWALMGVTYFAATGMLIGGSLLSDLRKGKVVFALLVIGSGIMVFYRLGDIYHLEINYESAGQLAGFLKYNIHKPDWGYTLPGYLGYPARQFIIPAIPSLLFGNDVFWFQFGYAILFYSGVLCFFLGVRHYFSIKQHGELWALFTVLSCFTFHYLMEYLYNMEQVMLPVCFVMHALGWFLLSLKKLTPPRVLILAWIAGLLGTSYTPDLAAWILFQIFFLLVLARAARQGRRAQIVLWVSVWAYTLTFGLCSFLTRGDVRLTPQPGHSAESFLIALKVFFLGHPQEYMPLPVAILVAIFFLLALTGRLGFIKWITAVWFLAVVYFSATSAGYTSYDPVNTMKRSILMIPVMMLACWDSYLGLFKKRIEPILAVILCLPVAAAAVQLYFERQKSYEPTSSEFFISFLLNKAESGGIRHGPAIFLSMTTQVGYHPTRYFGEYFLPLWQIRIHPTDSLKLDNPDPSQPLVIITDSEIAQKNLLPAGWTGTDEMTYLDPYRRRFPVRYGLYRYSKVPEAIPAGLPNMDLSEPGVTAFQGGHGRRKGEFDNPRAIAVDSAGNIYVADTNNGRVQKFSPNGTFVTQIGPFEAPNGIAIDHTGNIYVVEVGSKHRVQKVGPDGSFIAVWAPALYGPHKIAIGPDDSIYVVDSGRTRIVKFSPDGRVLTTWGSGGHGDGQFADHTSVAVDPTSNKVYVADPINSRIQVFDSDGKFLTKWLVPEWGQPLSFEDLAIDSQRGRLYASSAHMSTILVFDLQGNKVGTLAPTPPDKLEGPSGLALAKDKLFVLDSGSARVSVIDLQNR